MFLTEMPRTQLLRYCCRRLGFGPSEATFLSERFPLRPQGSLIFREKEPPSPKPAFKKKSFAQHPPLFKIYILELALFLSFPWSPFPSQVLTRSLKVFTQKGRPHSTTRLFVYHFSFPHFSFPHSWEKLALFICPL